MDDLAGKLVLVTGAASGIGRATALEFSRQGAVLALVDIDEEGLEALSSEIERSGGESFSFKTDLRDPDDVEALKVKVLDARGVPDVLMNAAGVAIVCCVEKISIEDWEWVLDLNLTAYIRVIHAFIGEMFARGSGHVVNVASAAGLFAVPYQAPYNTSKHAVVGLTDSIRQEGARHGVGATVVCPGAILTPIIGSARLLEFSDAATEEVKRIAASPEKLACAIVNGVRKNKSMVIYPPWIKLFYWLKRLSLKLADIVGKLVARAFYSRHHCG